MKQPIDPQLDLTISRVIKAPRPMVWSAWADPRAFEQWWVPHPEICRVVTMDLVPGGGFVTELSVDGGPFGPHFSGCFLAVEPERRLVFTNALLAGFRPAAQPFMTAHIGLADHPEGTEYTAHVMHKDPETRELHDEMGFFDGWGTVIGQLAELIEKRLQ